MFRLTARTELRGRRNCARQRPGGMSTLRQWQSPHISVNMIVEPVWRREGGCLCSNVTLISL